MDRKLCRSLKICQHYKDQLTQKTNRLKDQTDSSNSKVIKDALFVGTVTT